jgi:hypothetical protein
MVNAVQPSIARTPFRSDFGLISMGDKRMAVDDRDDAITGAAEFEVGAFAARARIKCSPHEWQYSAKLGFAMPHLTQNTWFNLQLPMQSPRETLIWSCEG